MVLSRSLRSVTGLFDVNERASVDGFLLSPLVSHIATGVGASLTRMLSPILSSTEHWMSPEEDR